MFHRVKTLPWHRTLIFARKLLKRQLFYLRICLIFFYNLVNKKERIPLQTRVEPPILLSRLLIFVFAAMIVVLGALGFTLYKMYPLDRPQVFFLLTAPKNDINIILREMIPNEDRNMSNFIRSFIREYIRARNEVVPNAREMRTKWGTDVDGVVYAWSSPQVFNDFTQTNMWNAWMSGVPDFEFSCSVEFENNAIEPVNLDTNEYSVNFRYFCSDNNRQMDRKDYKIRLKLDFADGTEIKWSDQFNNPLGVRVSEYVIESGNGDPLDTGYLAGDGDI